MFNHQNLNKPSAAVLIDLLKPVPPTKQRPEDFFEGCIVLDDDDDGYARNDNYVPISPNPTEDDDDDDIQEIERQRLVMRLYRDPDNRACSRVCLFDVAIPSHTIYVLGKNFSTMLSVRQSCVSNG